MSSVTFLTTLGGDGSTVTDDSNASTGLANGGHRTRFVPALSQMVAIASVLQGRVLSLSDTSTSSVAIGIGSKSFTTAKFYTFAVGQFVVIASAASPANYMYGQVTAYTAGTGALTVNVVAVAGSGTFASWSISCAVPSGAHVQKAGDTMTGNLTVPSMNGGPLAGLRNRIINGNMDIAQRGTSFTNPASGAYTLDRWLVTYDGSGASRTVAQMAFPVGSVEADEAVNYLLFSQTAAGSGGTYNGITQRIEGVRSLAGKQVTVSFYAKFGAANTLPSVLLRQNFGSGGSASVDTVVMTSQAVTTGFVRYYATVTLPSISGKTVGAGDFLELQVLLPVNQTFAFAISGVQVEVGPQVTPVEMRPVGVELALCQRYYSTTAGTISTYGVTGSTYHYTTNLPVAMRGAPVLAYSISGSATNCTPANMTMLNAFVVRLEYSLPATGYAFYNFTATATAEL